MRLRPYLPLLLLATSCVPLGTPITNPNAPSSQQAKPAEYYAERTLRYQDYIYDPSVRSVQCYVPTAQVNDIFNPPIVPLSQDQPIRLEFDILGEQAPRLTAKLIHCDLNWQPSQLTDMQFLSEINEFTLTNYQTAVNTKVPYYHYALQVPRVKLSGNYVLVVQNQSGAPLLSRRLLVYENQVVARLEQGILAGGQADRYAYQQLNFSINYSAVNLVNPAAEVKVVLRQNFRWDNAHYNLRPTFVRDADRLLEYQYFNFENAFPGLSEYRYFDARSLQANGLGVARLLRQPTPTQVELLDETTRNGLAYNQYVDANGQRVFENREFGNGAYNADYAQVTFHLKATQPAPGPVYIFGALSDWQLKEEFRLAYDSLQQRYTGRALLKQGYYNYSYALAPKTPGAAPDEVYFEGTHTETENQYDLLVYYRPPGTRTDLLIAYQTLDLNKR
ncbi:DUF5103 domain-containing protein [Hymenobacter sp. HMF4947]|uniref:DUF5103 domain-containing protein n=1 Tax=Hymenobacter ginkgonis TaxID=2682976 RepID=A0A7K1TG16_9BACT|nr:DUF5103 domain-containing protein [Hymenobacter ginkgonis]MVN77346.1 DUF5103 domain-containing protein [Hymenobacter ginkgonis]